MSGLTPKEIEGIVQRATERAIESKLGQFYIDREEHYADHQFIKAFRRWTDEAKGTVLRAVVKTLVGVAFLLLLLGFIFWGKGYFGK